MRSDPPSMRSLAPSGRPPPRRKSMRSEAPNGTHASSSAESSSGGSPRRARSARRCAAALAIARVSSRARASCSGTENVPTQGSVTNAVYVWPRIHFRPLENLVLRLGLLYARAVADLVDPFLSFRAGGVNHNFFDASANRRDLGFEMQAGVGYTQTLIGQLVLHLGLEWGHLFPGSAFTDAAGSRRVDVDHFTGRVILSFKY